MAVPFIGRVIRRLRAAGAHIAAFILFSGLLTYIFILYQVSPIINIFRECFLILCISLLKGRVRRNNLVGRAGKSCLPILQPRSRSKIQHRRHRWTTQQTGGTSKPTRSHRLIRLVFLSHFGIPYCLTTPDVRCRTQRYKGSITDAETGLSNGDCGDTMHVGCASIINQIARSYTEFARIPPWYADICWPKTTAAETASKGKWVRVERNINWRSGAWYLVRHG